jgi:hypothetical protein
MLGRQVASRSVCLTESGRWTAATFDVALQDSPSPGTHDLRVADAPRVLAPLGAYPSPREGCLRFRLSAHGGITPPMAVPVLRQLDAGRLHGAVALAGVEADER